MSDFLPSAIQLGYLVAASLFIVGLKQLGSPATARQGNVLAAIGMLIAIVGTLLEKQVVSYELIVVGIIIGSIAGTIMAKTVAMTDMPQMVGLLNGFGGAASALVAVGEFWRYLSIPESPAPDATITILLGVLIGGITFTGSLVAFAKLQELLPGAPMTFPLQQPFNAMLAIALLAGSGYMLTNPENVPVFLGLVAISNILGIMFVLPIGGGDMPVVVSLLNSYSGIAASVAGFILMNNMLIIAGALVGASGIILTQIMCKAMNRSLGSVLFSAFGSGGGSAAGGRLGRILSAPGPQDASMAGGADVAHLVDVARGDLVARLHIAGSRVVVVGTHCRDHANTHSDATARPVVVGTSRAGAGRRAGAVVLHRDDLCLFAFY